ncbi:MAG: hypothetical protein VW397_00265 [Candidatus Margulisiibacteriota bacterium]
MTFVFSFIKKYSLNKTVSQRISSAVFKKSSSELISKGLEKKPATFTPQVTIRKKL